MQRTVVGQHPTEEVGATLGHNSYETRSKIECNLYIKMLEVAYPAPSGAFLVIETRPDGSRSVVARWKADVKEHELWAFKVEEGLPNWSKHAEERLGISVKEH